MTNRKLSLLLALLCSIAALVVGGLAAPAATLFRTALLHIHPAFALSYVPAQWLVSMGSNGPALDLASAQWTVAYVVAVVCVALRDSVWFWAAALVVAGLCEIALLLALMKIGIAGPMPSTLITTQTFAVTPALAASLFALDALGAHIPSSSSFLSTSNRSYWR